MNANFLKSALPMIQVRLDSVFGGEATRFSTYKRKQTAALSAVVALGTAEATQIMEGSECTGVKLLWLKDCTAIKNTDCEPIDPTCDFTVPQTMTSDEKTYIADCHFKGGFSIDDDLCRNEFAMEELIMQGMYNEMLKLDGRLNKRLYREFALNATPNLAPQSIGNIIGTRTEVTSGNWTSEILLQMANEAGFTGLEDYFILDGMNLVVNREIAEFRKVNDHERSHALIYDKYDSMLLFDDPRDAFDATGRNSTFLIDRNGVRFFNFTPDIGATPIEIKDNLFEFSMVSPLSGVRYYVKKKEEETGKKQNSLRCKKLHSFELACQFTIAFAPNQCDGVGNVMEFTKIP